MTKKKDKNEGKRISSSFFDTKGKIIGACIVGAVILLLVFIFMLYESGNGKLIIKNSTDFNLVYVKTQFVNEEGAVDAGMKNEDISANTTLTKSLKPLNLSDKESNLEVRIKFANSKEMLTDVGSFIGMFKGNVKITIEKTDDPNLLTLKIKASSGIFQTKTGNCNEKATIDLSKGMILE